MASWIKKAWLKLRLARQRRFGSRVGGGAWRAPGTRLFHAPRGGAVVATGNHDERRPTRRYVSDVSITELRAVIAAKEHATTPTHKKVQMLEIS